MEWVRAIEEHQITLPDEITTAQRRLLRDFARIWEYFARQLMFGPLWNVFSQMLQNMVTEPWADADAPPDGGFQQLMELCDWARINFPASTHSIGMLL